MKKTKIAVLFALPLCVAALSSCSGQSDNCFYGLIEGDYYFVNSAGTSPDGWEFNQDSLFVFASNGPEETFSEKELLPNGEWQMNKAVLSKDGSFVVERNYRMKWSHTPFDDMPGISVSGVYSETNVCHEVMYQNTSTDETWKPFSFVECQISSLNSDGSKRSVTIVFKYKDDAKKELKVTFAMK